MSALRKNRFKFRTQYNEIEDAEERENTTQYPIGESLTQQHFAADADLNTIVERFGITDGSMPVAHLDPQAFGDFSDVPDLKEALDIVRRAQTNFAALPAKLRERFHNDPAALWNFVQNPDNDDESVRLGLVRRADPPTPPQETTVKKDGVI